MPRISSQIMGTFSLTFQGRKIRNVDLKIGLKKQNRLGYEC